jgi:hypothetical protein
MRAQEDYQGTDAFDKMKDQVLEKKEQGQALEQFLQVTEKWEALKSTMNQQCGLNLNVGATSGLTSNYNRFAGLAIPK